jgi:hypothetical protein|tara:strand:+ start:1998 stop:2963 length:966 start_codon:yes stop_codon:yes gene_type:complete
MAYTNAQATPRSDIYALVMQANADFNKMFIGDQILPVKGEDVKRGIYMKAKLANGELMNGDAAPRANGDGYQRINRKYDVDQYDAQEYGLEAVIDDAYESEVERFMNLEATEAMLLERSLRISYEVRVAAAVMNASTFNATAGAVNYTEANLATINLPADIQAAKNRLLLKGIVPNAIIMSQNVFSRIQRSTLMQNQIFGVVPKSAGQFTLPGEDDVARALGVDTLFVAKSARNTNKKGLAHSGSFIWSDTYISVAQIEGGEYQAGGIGRTIQWNKDTTGLFTPETYRSDERRSNILRVRQHTAEKIVDETAAELITTSFS